MKDHRIAVGRVFLLATLLALLPTPVTSQGDSATVQVVRVIDGDTIQVCCVFGDRVKVRYIGVDTPETHHPMRGVEPYGMAKPDDGIAAWPVETVPPRCALRE